MKVDTDIFHYQGVNYLLVDFYSNDPEVVILPDISAGSVITKCTIVRHMVYQMRLFQMVKDLTHQPST